MDLHDGVFDESVASVMAERTSLSPPPLSFTSHVHDANPCRSCCSSAAVPAKASP